MNQSLIYAELIQRNWEVFVPLSSKRPLAVRGFPGDPLKLVYPVVTSSHRLDFRRHREDWQLCDSLLVLMVSTHELYLIPTIEVSEQGFLTLTKKHEMFKIPKHTSVDLKELTNDVLKTAEKMKSETQKDENPKTKEPENEAH